MFQGSPDKLIVCLCTQHDEKVLSFCYKKARKVSEIAEHLRLSDSTYFPKKYWKTLKRMDISLKVKYRERHAI